MTDPVVLSRRRVFASALSLAALGAVRPGPFYPATIPLDADGAHRFRTVKPVPYPGRTPHIHFAVSGPGFEGRSARLPASSPGQWPAPSTSSSAACEADPAMGTDIRNGNMPRRKDRRTWTKRSSA